MKKLYCTIDFDYEKWTKGIHDFSLSLEELKRRLTSFGVAFKKLQMIKRQK